MYACQCRYVDRQIDMHEFSSTLNRSAFVSASPGLSFSRCLDSSVSVRVCRHISVTFLQCQSGVCQQFEGGEERERVDGHAGRSPRFREERAREVGVVSGFLLSSFLVVFFFVCFFFFFCSVCGVSCGACGWGQALAGCDGEAERIEEEEKARALSLKRKHLRRLRVAVGSRTEKKAKKRKENSQDTR